MRRDDRSPEACRGDVEGELRTMLEAIRELILEVAPEIEERIAYGMLDYPGLANLAAQKHYVALYVASSILAKRRADFPGVSRGKSCLRFKKLEQIEPDALKALLREVLAFRASEAR